MTALWVIVLCGALSIVYAIWATASVLKADAGNPRMQEIAGAVAEGAQAYLKRQYITIGIVGIVGLAVPWFLVGRRTATRCPRAAVGPRCLHRHQRLGARQRAPRAGCHEVACRRARHLVQGRRRPRHAG